MATTQDGGVGNRAGGPTVGSWSDPRLPTVFVNEPSLLLACGICNDLLFRPVLSSCGHTFCRKCTRRHGARCPEDGNALSTAHFVPNLAIEAQIEDLLIYCRFAQFKEVLSPDGTTLCRTLDNTGCTQELRLGDRAEHELSCPYAAARSTACPNSPACGKIPHRLLPQHLRECARRPCRYHVLGCPVEGTLADTRQHEENCRYKDHAAELTLDELGRLRVGYDGLAARLAELLAQSEALDKAVRASEEHDREIQASVDQMDADLAHEQGEQEDLVMPFDFQCIGTFRGHAGPVWTLTADGSRLFSAASDQLVKVWDLTTFACIISLEGHKGVIHCMEICGNRLYSADSVGMVHVWDLDTYQQAKAVLAGSDIISAMTKTATHLYTASYACITMWNVPSLDCVKKIGAPSHWIRCLVFDPVANLIVSTSGKRIDFWGVDDLAHEKELKTNWASIRSLVVTSDYLICGTTNQNIHVYSAETYEHVAQLTGHLGTVLWLEVSDCEQFLFSASEDSTIKIWNLDTRMQMQTLKRHEGSINVLLVSAGSDEGVKIFRPVPADKKPR